MASRPKAGEDEDDLLKLQAEFLQGGHASGVSIKRPDKRGQSSSSDHASTRDIVKMDVSEEPSSDPIPAKKSKFRKEGDTKQRPAYETVTGKPIGDDDIELLKNRKETGFSAVLTSIVERDTRNEMVSAPVLGSQGFPNVFHLDNLAEKAVATESGSSHKKKKKSLFAQQIEAKSIQHSGIPQTQMLRKPNVTTVPPRFNNPDDFPERSYIISGEGLGLSQGQSESQNIHEENIQTLSSMTESEILEEQRKLLESADPKILQFLKNRRAKQEPIAEEEMATTSSFQESVRMKVENKDFSPPIKPSSEWLNMGVIEKEKMEWMTDLPAPDSISSETGKPARFDFDGNIVASDSDIPVNRGLHHHGDEPERAGYTLEELFTLVRSMNLQQKILSLQTIAKIIRMAKSGALAHRINTPFIPALLEGGIVILIRMSLDDPAEGVAFAAIDALHALLCSPLDQEAVSQTWVHHIGNMVPLLTPSKTLQKEAEPEDPDEENQEQETDADVVKRDVIQALISRMMLLQRFHYFLGTMRPQAVVVSNMMDILARVAQHSLNMAYEITKHKGLIDRIVKEFLPTAWSPQDPNTAVSQVFGLPVPSALRLIRYLCQAGRHITATLISNHQLLTILLRYLAVNEEGLSLPTLEASKLHLEALAVWRVCVTYGFGLQIFFDLYSETVKKVSKLEDEWNKVLSKKDKESYFFMRKSGLICVMERMLYVVEKRQPQKLQEMAGQQQSQVFGPPINWSHMKCLFQPVRACVCQMLKDIGQKYPVMKQNLTMPTASINFLASFYETEERQTDVDVLSRAEDVESLFQDSLNPFLSSFGFSILVDNLCPYSNILSKSVASLEESTPSMPSLGVRWTYSQESNIADDVEQRELNTPVLREHSPFGFLTSVFRLILNVCKRHKALIEKLLASLVNSPGILSYMQKVCLVPDSAFSFSFWTRKENLLQFLWLKCCLLTPCVDMTLAHRIALRLLCRLQGGDEYFVHDIFTSIVFSPFFIREGEEIQLASQSLADMNLSESLYLKSATQDEINVSKSQLLREAFTSLATIRGHFLMALGGMEKDAIHSRNIHCSKPSEIQSQLLPGQEENLMPKDWMYLPLIHVYNKTQQRKNVSSDGVTSQDVSMVTSVLQWNYMYEVWRPKEIDHTSVTTKVSRIMCAFLAGNDLFLDKRVQTFLAGLLREFVCPRFFNALDFEERVPGILSFYDLYQDFLEHYESVSFGDPVFGLYVLLPLQQKHSSLYRKAVWGERRKLLRTLRVSFQDCLIPVENFLETVEEDVELLGLYLHALITQSVLPNWSPIMYLTAVHHVNRFLFINFDDGQQNVRDKMWKTILDHFERMSSVIYYKKFDICANQGLDLYDKLPDNRKVVLSCHMTRNDKMDQLSSLVK